MIRPATTADLPAVARLVDVVWGDHEIMSDPGRYRNGALVATEGDQVVGVGSCIESSRTPELATAHIDVVPDRRRQGLGTALFDELVQRTTATLLVGRTLRSQPGAEPFATALGFEFAESALEGWIDPAAVSAWLESAPAAIPQEARILVDAEYGAAADLLATHFRRTHPWLPEAAPAGPERFVGDAFAVAGVEADGELIGAASLQRPFFGSDAGRAFLLWVSGPSDAVVTALVAAALREAEAHQLQVRVECNSHNMAFWRCLESIPGAPLQRDLTVWTMRR